MSMVLAKNWGNNIALKRGASAGGGFVLKRSKTPVANDDKTGLDVAVFVMVVCLVFAGALYLYQVNNISIKGYEVKAIENRIQGLEEENQKLRIREVESRSMYNIEKNTENLNLVNAVNVTYVEMNGPMAMK